MPLSATDVSHLNALTALDEGRAVADADQLAALVCDGLADAGDPPGLTLEGRLRLRNLLSCLRGEIERGLDGFPGC